MMRGWIQRNLMVQGGGEGLRCGTRCDLEIERWIIDRRSLAWNSFVKGRGGDSLNTLSLDRDSAYRAVHCWCWTAGLFKSP